MITHYLLIALINFRRTPSTALINIFTLALGLMGFVIAYAVVEYWDNSDRHFSNADRTYVITSTQTSLDGSLTTGAVPQTNELYQRYLRVDFPEFEFIGKALGWNRQAPVTVDGRKMRLSAVAVDEEFLEIFDLPFIVGESNSALSRPDSVVLSEETALRMFDSTDVVGKTVTLGGDLLDATVTGVIASIVQPSHMGNSERAVLQLDLITSLAFYQRLENARAARINPESAAMQVEAVEENWFRGNEYITYAMLQPDRRLDIDSFNKQLNDFVERHADPDQFEYGTIQAGAVPLSALTIADLNFQLLGGSASGFLSITTLLFGTGALVLVVACMNYANLATARASRRAREIGLRKVMGAQRTQIVAQYLIEAGLLTMGALVVALCIAELLAPAIFQMTNIDVRLSLFTGSKFWLFMLFMSVGVTLMAGAYPAFVLSHTRPIQALQLGSMRLGSKFISRALVGIQFVVTSLLVIVVIVMAMQNYQMKKSGMGASTDAYVVINNDSEETGLDNELFVQELEKLPLVMDVTQMSPEPWNNRLGIAMLTRTQEETAQTYPAFWNTIGYDFFSTFGIEVIAGRVFDRGRSDMPLGGREPSSPTPRNIVIDREYASQLGFSSPNQAVGTLLYFPSPPGSNFTLPSRQIIGVVENRALWLRSYGATANSYYLGDAANMSNQVVLVSEQNVSEALSEIEELWQQLNASAPLTYRFVDDMFEESYRTYARINQAFAGLVIFSMIIAFIGLFGMAIQTVGRRLHEVGVRKSFGASTLQIAAMLLRDFSKRVVIANLIAWPFAFMAVQYYLSIFFLRIELTPLPFILSLTFVLVVAWAAVASQVIRAVRINPATVLSSE